MKILEIIPQLTFDGGAERFIVDLCNQLSLENDVTLLVLYGPDKFPNYRDLLSSRVKTIFLNKKKGFDITIFVKIDKVINCEAPEVVHTHLRSIIYVFLSILRRHNSIRFIHTIHSDAFLDAGKGPLKFIRKFLFKKKFCKPIVISMNGQKSFEACYGFTADLVTNGRAISLHLDKKIRDEVEQYRNSKETTIFVNVARIETVKNHLLLCNSFKKFVDMGYDAQLLIIGGLFNQDIVEKINSIDCKYIHLLGIKPDPFSYMRCCDAFCLSSIIEGMPISLIEAFAAGLIPICTPVGGINDMIVNGKNGILSKNLSENAYEKALEEYFTMSPQERYLMRRNSLDSYRHYTIKACADSYLKKMQ